MTKICCVKMLKGLKSIFHFFSRFQFISSSYSIYHFHATSFQYSSSCHMSPSYKVGKKYIASHAFLCNTLLADAISYITYLKLDFKKLRFKSAKSIKRI